MFRVYLCPIQIEKMKNRQYPAKLLLFGEYTVLLEGQALAIPYPQLYGQWNNEATESDPRIWDFFHYLKQNEELFNYLNINELNNFLKEGLAFDSSIPLGYGLGSSGAFCAAIYDTFAHEKEENLSLLRSILATLENHFHASSSGVDPLICYLQKSLLLEGNKMEILEDFHLPKDDQLQFFLLDTRFARRTNHLVSHFIEATKKDAYKEQIEANFMPYIEEIISAIIQKESSIIWKNMHEISFFQMRYFQPMIPEYLHDLWLEGLNSDFYKLKLCGAGGGGFFLGITKDIDQLKATIDFDILPI